MAMYGTKKTHCVKRASEIVALPSDFDNSFVDPIECTDSESFAEGIVDYFMSRQKMSINENKMYLINNRYLMHDKIVSHYSEMGSKCSDYELAQYILFYVQAAQMFGDEKKIQKEMLEFKQLHSLEFSTELALAVNLSLSFFELITNIKSDDETYEVYIDQNVFWKVKNDYVHYSKTVVDDDIGVFDEWANVFVFEHLTFAYMLFANNKSLPDEMRRDLYQKTKEYGMKAIECIGVLEQRAPCKGNNDEIGLVSLLKAYVYRNIFMAEQFLGEEDANEWLRKTLEERTSLKNNFGKGTIDTQLYNNFCMEYYLSLISYLTVKKDIDKFEIYMYKNEMQEYLNSVKKENNANVYLRQIAVWCDKVGNK